MLVGEHVVDKTAFLPVLLEKKWTFFLRPRRFGKSFWVSTLKTFFSGAKEVFQDFAIWHQRIVLPTVAGVFVWDPSSPDPKEHNFPSIPVLRLDFSRFAGVEDAAAANRELLCYLNQRADEEGIGHVESFPEFISALANHPMNAWKQVVVLIDEYDALLTANLGPERRGVFEDLRKNFVRTFLTQLGSVDEEILFCFVTGSFAFGWTTIWSSGAQLIDYSLDGRLAAMCGFTHEEAETIMQRAQIAQGRFAEFWPVLAARYGGYRFNYDGAPVHVFNPFLIRRIVETGIFVDGWAATASESVLKCIAGKALPSLPCQLSLTTLERAEEFPELDSDTKIVKMLFRAGYLTIEAVDHAYVQLAHVNTETTVALAKDYFTLAFPAERVDMVAQQEAKPTQS